MLEGTSSLKLFCKLDDPRTDKHSQRHQLSDIMLLTILGVICGADSWVGLERFGKFKYGWLKTILELPNGIPSHDTIGDFFSRQCPEQLRSCFLSWVNSVFDFSGGEIIAIDGKTLHHSFDNSISRPAIHMVNAWACKNELVLGQFKTSERSNQKTHFDYYEVVDGEHNRIEVRKYWVTEEINWLTQKSEWKGLKSIGMVEYESTDKSSGEISVEKRFFISSLTAHAKKFSNVIGCTGA